VNRPASWLVPEWTSSVVGALMTTREGGVSDGPFASMNLGAAVGDDAARVAANRDRFAAACRAAPVFLKQVHGRRVVRIGAVDASPLAAVLEADASFTTEPDIACTVQAADCLPVLLAAPEGRAVAAAHAGWRGLAAGVVDATVASICEAAGCAPAELEAWLGACIGPRRFEVGGDVLEAFSNEPFPVDNAFRPLRPGKWLADLPALARARLAAAGVRKVRGGGWCTVEDRSRFFSFRRDRIAGRMAAAIWVRRRSSSGC
jgi:polyphenol oxidase